MPHHHPVIFSLNRRFTKRTEKYDSGQLRSDIGNSARLIDAVPKLLAHELEQGRMSAEQINGLLQFAGAMPAAIDVAIVAAVKQALEDDYWVQVTWQPAVDWELRTWALRPTTSDDRGVLNLFILSPDLDAATT